MLPGSPKASEILCGSLNPLLEDFSWALPQVTAFTPPSTSIRAGGAAGLTVSAVNAAVQLKGDWRYKYKAGFIPIKGHGSFDADSSGIDASL